MNQSDQQSVLTQCAPQRATCTTVTLFLAWFLFYWLTAATVHIEADDAYQYAYDVETASFAQLLHPYHPLYLALMRGLFALGNAMGIVDRSFELMLVAGAALAATAVVLFSLVVWKRLGVRKWPAVGVGGLLGFSYGFWRYAAEAEVYALASLLALGLVWWTFAEQGSIKRAAFGGVIAWLAVLSHVLNVIPALVSAPLYLALRNGKKHVMVYLAVFVLACIPAIYVIGSAARVEYPNYATLKWPDDGPVERFELGEIPTSAAVMGHAVLSGNFLFTFPGYRVWVRERFPGQRLEGENLLGASAWPLTGPLGLVTSILTIVAFGWTLYRGIARGLPALSDPVVLASLLWLVLYLAIIGYTGTLEQPEAWLLALVPFWLLFARLVHVGVRYEGNALLVLFLPGALLLHNFIGGMAMLNDPESDRHLLKARWLVENAGHKDVILTSESAGFTRYLKYYSDAEVVGLHQLSAWEVAKIQEESIRSAERVFVTGEVVYPPNSMRSAPEPWMSEPGRVVERFRGATRQVHQDDWGGVFLLQRTDGSDAEVGE